MIRDGHALPNTASKGQRACEVMRRLGEEFPDARIALDYDSPWHLLVAVILSAQTTDVGVNKVTPVLFERFPGPDDLAAADPLEVEEIAVDTHVFRLAHRLGLRDQSDPNKVEADLCALLPHEEWFHVNYRFIEHGRAVCTAKRPICGACALSDICPSAFKIKGWREAP